MSQYLRIGLFFLILFMLWLSLALDTHEAPASMRQAVAVDLSRLESVAKESHGTQAEILSVLRDIRDQRASPRIDQPAEATNAATVAPVVMLAGSPVDFESKATGRFTVAGMTYQEALMFHGFTGVESLDEARCRAIYDGWRSSQQTQNCPGGVCPVRRSK